MKLNNKGYMLIEIILAFVLAMTVVYFLTDMTIKLKNKNDDLLVKTLVSTDQAIAYNKIMEFLYSFDGVPECNDITSYFVVDTNNNSFKSGENFTNVVSKYADLGELVCNKSGDTITIQIPIEVEQITDESFDVNINYSGRDSLCD